MRRTASARVCPVSARRSSICLSMSSGRRTSTGVPIRFAGMTQDDIANEGAIAMTSGKAAMPTAPPSRCTDPTCHAIAIAHGRCAAHQRPAWQHRKDSHWAGGSTRRWRKGRADYLRDHPFCAVCGRIANTVDHIIPIESGGAIWDRSNWQSLCTEHHDVKTKRERSAHQPNTKESPWRASPHTRP